MLSLKWLALFISLALAAVAPIPRGEKQANEGACCFSLKDSATGAIVRQDKQNGITFLNNPDFPEGWYCLYLFDPLDYKRTVLYDQDMNACILTGMGVDGEFICLDGTPGFAQWTIASGNLLAHDNNTGFTSCPNPYFSKKGSQILGKKEGSGCKAIKLKATGFKGTCGNLS